MSRFDITDARESTRQGEPKGTPETLGSRENARNEEIVQDRREEELLNKHEGKHIEKGEAEKLNNEQHRLNQYQGKLDIEKLAPVKVEKDISAGGNKTPELTKEPVGIIVSKEHFQKQIQAHPEAKETIQRMEEQGLIQYTSKHVIIGPIQPKELAAMKEEGLVKVDKSRAIVATTEAERQAQAIQKEEQPGPIEKPGKTESVLQKNEPEKPDGPAKKYNFLADAHATFNILAGDRSSIHNYNQIIYNLVDPREQGPGKQGPKVHFEDFQNASQRRTKYDYSPTENVQEKIRDEESRQGREAPTQDKDIKLSRPELQTLNEIGKFRVMDRKDMEEIMFQGNRNKAKRAIQNLSAQGLIERHVHYFNNERHEIFTLTTKGKDFMEQQPGRNPEQQLYAGIAKNPRELNHDIGIFRAYAKEAERIQKEGGRVEKVSLDYELKGRGEGITVNGKTVIPDLQIEYTDRDGERNKANIEIVTGNYSPGAVQEKAQAGFSLYASEGERARVGKILEQHSMAQEVFAL